MASGELLGLITSPEELFDYLSCARVTLIQNKNKTQKNTLTTASLSSFEEVKMLTLKPSL